MRGSGAIDPHWLRDADDRLLLLESQARRRLPLEDVEFAAERDRTWLASVGAHDAACAALKREARADRARRQELKADIKRLKNAQAAAEAQRDLGAVPNVCHAACPLTEPLVVFTSDAQQPPTAAAVPMMRVWLAEYVAATTSVVQAQPAAEGSHWIAGRLPYVWREPDALVALTTPGWSHWELWCAALRSCVDAHPLLSARVVEACAWQLPRDCARQWCLQVRNAAGAWLAVASVDACTDYVSRHRRYRHGAARSALELSKNVTDNGWAWMSRLSFHSQL